MTKQFTMAPSNIVTPVRDMLQQFGDQIFGHLHSLTGMRCELLMVSYSPTTLDYVSSIPLPELVEVLEKIQANVKLRIANGATQPQIVLPPQ
jgi:hypothetical protein